MRDVDMWRRHFLLVKHWSGFRYAYQWAKDVAAENRYRGNKKGR